jgi:hypothetical protein
MALASTISKFPEIIRPGSSIFFPTKNFVIQNLNLENANAATNGGAIHNEGNLTLENILLKNNKQNGVLKSMTQSPGSVLKVIGNVQLKN